MIRRRHFIRLASALLLLALAGCAPRRIEVPLYRYDNDTVVRLSAEAHARDIGGLALWVQPTGSMRPTIQDYDWVVVALPDKAPYAGVQEGQVLLYNAEWTAPGTPRVLHRAAQKDRDGWIMSGDNNAHYESKWRVNAANYLGRAVAIYRTRAL